MVHAHDARSHALAMIALMGRKEIPLIVSRRVPFQPKSVRLKYGERVTRFIAISNAVKEAMTRAGIEAGRISVVHSGIAPRIQPVLPRDWRSELGWSRETVVCGVVGAMTAEKGVDLLGGIGRSMSDRARNRVRLVLIGGAAAEPSSLGGLVTHSAGFVEEIDPAVAGLDILWHPSKAEGLGTSVIDAMALGVPPIAFSVGGIPEVIEDGISGRLVPAGDVNAFAAAASSLVEDETLRARLALGAKERAKKFDAVEMTKRTEAVYQEVLSG
jgi:glycosyltransferase involved in cell wall biosynthesis